MKDPMHQKLLNMNKAKRQLDGRIEVAGSNKFGEYYGRYDETGKHLEPFVWLL